MFLFRKFYLSCIDDDESSDEDNVEDDFEEEVIEAHGVLGEQHEKPDDLLDNYFIPGEDDFEVQHHLPVQQSYKWEGWGRRKMILRRKACRKSRFFCISTFSTYSMVNLSD